MIEWGKKYETGIKEIDHQHQWLFRFVNSLEEELTRDAPDIDIEETLRMMADYAQSHFRFEEDCVNKWRCPFAENNKCAHQQFIEAYKNFMERYEREGHSLELAWKIHHMVEEWIINHIGKIDIKLRSFADASKI
ncbi:MAG: bacteriohemerythrin [Candidatus Omnitrophota bacterium]